MADESPFQQLLKFLLIWSHVRQSSLHPPVVLHHGQHSFILCRLNHYFLSNSVKQNGIHNVACKIASDLRNRGLFIKFHVLCHRPKREGTLKVEFTVK
jgi:hypothetical protein